MREKKCLRQSTSQKIVTLPNGTTFKARYERISKNQLPRNIRVKNARKISPRTKNRVILSLNNINQVHKIAERKKVRFNRLTAALKRMRNNK